MRFLLLLLAMFQIGCIKHSDFEVDGVAFVFEPDRPDLKTEEMRERLHYVLEAGMGYWDTSIHSLRTYYVVIYTEPSKLRHCWPGGICHNGLDGWFDWSASSIGLRMVEDCPESIHLIHELGHEHYWGWWGVPDFGDMGHSHSRWHGADKLMVEYQQLCWARQQGN